MITFRPNTTAKKLTTKTPSRPGDSRSKVTELPVAKPKAPGKMTARERLAAVCDPGSFFELDRHVTHHATDAAMNGKQPIGDGVITGFGTIHGRTVYLYSQDFSQMGGSVGRAHAAKICKVMDLAASNGSPIIGINDSGGARIQEGIMSLAGYGAIFKRNTQLSGVVPQISVILGPCAGGAVYSPAVTDFVVMSKEASMFVTGPKIVKVATHEDIDGPSLGGGPVHAKKTGVAHHVAVNDQAALAWVRVLMTYLPENNLHDAPFAEATEQAMRDTREVRSLVPEDTKKSYDVREVIKVVFDQNSFMEIQREWAQNISIGFARLDGRCVGVVANNPMVHAGCLDINASRKAARFIRFCNAFNIPLVTLIDVPGFLPGSEQEHNGVITHGAKLLYAYAEATVPKVSLVMRKAYGGAYIVMSSKEIGGDYCLAWPQAEMAVMGARGAVELLHRRELAGLTPEDPLYQEREEEYKAAYCNPQTAAEHGLIDAVIEPEQTRRSLVQLLKSIEHKRVDTPWKRNGNVPL